MKVYCIVVTYNGNKWIDKCLGSLINSTIPVKILVIDNMSTDGTPNIIRKKYPEVEVIEPGQNLGFGKANNIGLKRAIEDNADFILLLNQDAWVEPDTIKKLIEIQKANPEFNLLSPIHLNGNGDSIEKKFQEYLHHYTANFYSDLYLRKSNRVYASKFVNAACWLLTKECINEVGFFDPDFPHYGEDEEYANRLHCKSMKLGVASDVVIFHDRPQINDKNYSKDRLYVNTLLKLKTSKVRPSTFYILRKILGNYIMLYFVYFGKNSQIKKYIDEDILMLKLKNTY